MNSRFFNAPVRKGGGMGTDPSNRDDKTAVSHLVRCSDARARKLITYENALKYEILPLGLIDLMGREVLYLASEGEASDKRSELEFITEHEVRLIKAAGKLIREAIFKAYKGDDLLLSDTAAGLEPEIMSAERAEIDFTKTTSESAGFLKALIEYAVARSATDIHLIPLRYGQKIKVRINGKLHEHEKLVGTRKTHEEILRRIKVLSGLDISKSGVIMDSAFSVEAAGQPVRIRVSIIPVQHGDKVALRVQQNAGSLGLSDLGFESSMINMLQDFCQVSEGMLLISGPTGSGKTTTMYAAIEVLKKQNLNIITIEDPVEYELEGVCQTSINTTVGMDFGTCLRTALRHDPDVILLGEIRDSESAKIAFQAALTGHKVLSTIHARNIREIFLRLESLGVESLSIEQALSLAVSQRLVPVLCSACRVLDLKGANAVEKELFKPVGCSDCDYSGYRGRLPVTEALKFNSKTGVSGISCGGFDDDRNYLSPGPQLDSLLGSGKISLTDYDLIKNSYGL